MAAPTQADREGFAVLAARLLVSRGIVSSAEPRLSAFALDVVADGVPRSLYLHDMMAEALGAAPQERTAVVTACAHWLLGHPCAQAWEEMKASLLPVIRNAWFGTNETIRDRFHPDPHLAVFFSWSVPGEGLRYASEADVAAWGIDASLVRDQSYRNLGRAHERLEWIVTAERDDDTALRISADGLEASSLVLFPQLRLSALLTRERAHPVVAIPSRGALLARRARPDTLPRLAETAGAENLAAAQPLSGVPFAAGDGGDTALAAIRDLPATIAARRRLLLETYAAQSRILRSRFPDDEIPEPEERIGDLVCSWSEGRHALLPECASVKLFPKKKSVRPVSLEWWNVKSLIGSTFQEEPGLFPPRWRAFPWKRDDVRAFDDAEDDDAPDPEAEAHFAEEEAQWGYDEGSGDEEQQDDDDDVWQEGDPDVVCPFCGSGLRGEKACEVCGHSPADAREAVKASVAPTHAIRVLQVLVEGKHLELANRRALPVVGRAIAETLDGTGDWPAQAATLSARLVALDGVAELFLDDAALAEILARTAVGPVTPDAQIAARMSEVERAEAETLAGASGAVLARKILRAMWSEGALDQELEEEEGLEELETPLGARIAGLPDGAAIARAVFSFLAPRFGSALLAKSAGELRGIVDAAMAQAPAAVPHAVATVEAVPEKPDLATLPAAKRLLRRLLDEGHVEMVAGGSQELVEHAIAQLLASADAKDPEALHALLDEMDEDVVLFADASVLAALPKR